MIQTSNTLQGQPIPEETCFPTDDLFWTLPLESWWNEGGKRKHGACDWPVTDYHVPPVAAEPADGLPYMRPEEEEDLQRKVDEMEGIIRTLRCDLEGICEPLALVVDAIKKKAQFVNVSAAYSLLQQMTLIFDNYAPWRKHVKPLEDFLYREKKRALSPTTATVFIPTDEQLADAIISINGKGKLLDEYQKWMGVCVLCQSRYDFPHDLKACCDKLAALPYKEKLEIECKHDSVRKLLVYGFARENYTYWPTYRPRATEKKMFEKCFDVARTLEKMLEKLGF